MRERLANTPYLTAWLNDLRTALEPRGRKARLIEFLSEIDQASPAVKKVELAAVLRGERIPNGELVLRIQAWLKLTKPRRRQTDGSGKHTPAKRTE